MVDCREGLASPWLPLTGGGISGVISESAVRSCKDELTRVETKQAQSNLSELVKLQDACLTAGGTMMTRLGGCRVVRRRKPEILGQ